MPRTTDDLAHAAIEVHFTGNATVLLSYGPLTLLTNPNFLHRGQYAHLGYGLLSRRLTEPALDVDELPRLDGVVLSHLHGDRRDRRARRHLDSTVPVLRALLPPVMGSVLEFGPVDRPVRMRLYLSGDTLVYDGLDEITRRFPAADLAVLHLGGTRLPGGFVVTMDGAQGAELPGASIPRWCCPCTTATTR